MYIYSQGAKNVSLFSTLMSVVFISAFAVPLSNTDGMTGFVSVQRQNGVRTITAHLGGISAIETATGELPSRFSSIDESQPSFIFREVTDGAEIARVIYDGNYTAKNCFMSMDKDSIHDLQARVKSTVHRAPFSAAHNHEIKTKHRNNSSLDPSVTLPAYLQYVYNATDFTTVHYNSSWTSVPPTFIRSMISLDFIKSQCNKLFSEFPSHTVSARPGGSRRYRRGLLTYPKTLWCGSGTEAKKYDELGEDRLADICCRAHDTCPYLQIVPMDSKLYLRNIAPYTISHCKCDKMFHNCLKRAETPVARGVADVYFNKLKLKCFVTRQRKQCLETNWIGSCLRREKTETAVIRDARPFPEGKNFTKEEKALRRLKRRQLLELT